MFAILEEEKATWNYVLNFKMYDESKGYIFVNSNLIMHHIRGVPTCPMTYLGILLQFNMNYIFYIYV